MSNRKLRKTTLPHTGDYLCRGSWGGRDCRSRRVMGRPGRAFLAKVGHTTPRINRTTGVPGAGVPVAGDALSSSRLAKFSGFYDGGGHQVHDGLHARPVLENMSR